MARFDFDMAKQTHDPEFVSELDKKVDSAFCNLKASAIAKQVQDCVYQIRRISNALMSFCNRFLFVTWHVVVQVPFTESEKLKSAALDFVRGLPLPNFTGLERGPFYAQSFSCRASDWLSCISDIIGSSRWITLRKVVLEEHKRCPRLNNDEMRAVVCKAVLYVLVYIVQAAKGGARIDQDEIDYVVASQARQPLASSKTPVFRDLLDLTLGVDDDIPIKQRLYAAAAREPPTKSYTHMAREILKLEMHEEASPQNNDSKFDKDEFWETGLEKSCTSQ